LVPTNRAPGFAERLHRVTRDAYDRDSLEQLLKFRLGQRLDQITPAGSPFDTVVFQLILWADRDGRLLELAQAVAEGRPGRPDVALLLTDMEAAAASASPPPGGERLQAAGPEGVLEGVAALARAYERIKRVMPEGDQRTVIMEDMVRKIRELPLESLDLPARCHLSPSDGERLTAVVSLQKRAELGYLRWLSERLAVEYEFIGYQAAVALRHAAATLAGAQLEWVEAAARDAQRWVADVPGRSGRRDMIGEVMATLAARIS